MERANNFFIRKSFNAKPDLQFSVLLEQYIVITHERLEKSEIFKKAVLTNDCRLLQSSWETSDRPTDSNVFPSFRNSNNSFFTSFLLLDKRSYLFLSAICFADASAALCWELADTTQDKKAIQ